RLLSNAAGQQAQLLRSARQARSKGKSGASSASTVDCLVESNRNWKACQAQVQALKACQAKRSKRDQT
ncbi:unnamed protein product, partial [Urochloa humidicola]